MQIITLAANHDPCVGDVYRAPSGALFVLHWLHDEFVAMPLDACTEAPWNYPMPSITAAVAGLTYAGVIQSVTIGPKE